MGLSCWRYKVYDWSKTTWPVKMLFYHGDKAQRYEVISVEGIVLSRENKATDGDCTFDISPILPQPSVNLPSTNTLGSVNTVAYPPWLTSKLHCELTPCQDDALHAKAAALQIGEKVRITGNRFWDPKHLGHEAHWEIHPIMNIEVL